MRMTNAREGASHREFSCDETDVLHQWLTALAVQV